MTIPNANYHLLDRIAGGTWHDQAHHLINLPSRTPILLARKNATTHIIATYWDDHGTPLPDPEVTFTVDHGQQRLDVLSQEDHFDHDGREPRRRFRVAPASGLDGVPTAPGELDAYLHDWLTFIQTLRTGNPG